MKRKHSSIRLVLALIAAALLTGQAFAASSLQGNYGAAWRSFSVYSATPGPPVNTYSMRFATGINVSDCRVQLVSNGGKFVRNGKSRPINQEKYYAKVDLRPKSNSIAKKSVKFRKTQRTATYASHRSSSSSVKVPVVGHAGRFVGKLFGKNRRVA